eukprot:3533290-Rhodomonas_salina.1
MTMPNADHRPVAGAGPVVVAGVCPLGECRALCSVAGHPEHRPALCTGRSPTAFARAARCLALN